MGVLNERTKIRIAKEQRGRCYYCSLQLREDMTWEHLVARAHGGSNKLSNLTVVHAACNQMVGAMPYRLKLALHEIGHTISSDAFFLLASRLKPLAHTQRAPQERRRPKPPPYREREATILRLVEQLPEDMRPSTRMAA